MKIVMANVALVFSMSLLTGCDDKPTTEPTVSLREEVEKLDECTQSQRDAIDQTRDNNGMTTHCINAEANSQVTESELREAIDQLKNRLASGNITACKWTGSGIQGSVVSYCIPPSSE